MLPWSNLWSRNYFIVHWPALAPVLVNDFARGAISGLGVVNLVAGIADLVTLVRRSAERVGG